MQCGQCGKDLSRSDFATVAGALIVCSKCAISISQESVDLQPCIVCGELFEELDLEPSPSGSGKQVCASCAEDIQADLDQMRLER